MKFLLSIIIPTKDRYKYLKPLILLLNKFRFDKVEIIIQDNTVNNENILEFIKDICLPNLKYFHHKEKLTSVQNFDLAVLNSTGEYVCFIGDDDGVTRNIEECVTWMKKNDIEALRSRKGASYKWPDCDITQINKEAGVLVRHKYQYTFEYLDPLVELEKVLACGVQSLGLMPILYGGIVRRDILNEIYKIGNTYFPGASGDMANAVTLCFKVKKYVVVDFPIIIGGRSKETGGGIVKRKNHIAKLSEVEFISQEIIDNWEESIPPLWHGIFVYPETAIKALRYISKETYIDKINYDYMLAKFIFFIPSYYIIGLRFSKNRKRLLSYFLNFYSLSFLSKLKSIIYFFVRKRSLLYNNIIDKSVDDIICAENILFSITGEINFEDMKLLN